MLWHPKLNQILAGTQKGAVHCLYDPAVSVRGAVMVAGRTVKKGGKLRPRKRVTRRCDSAVQMRWHTLPSQTTTISTITAMIRRSVTIVPASRIRGIP